MFENKITFSTQKICKEIGIENPVPIKLNIPEWFKKMEHSIENKTVKGCMPFLDSLTTGYLLKTDQDIYVKHGYTDAEGNPKATLNYPALADRGSRLVVYGVNLNYENNVGHPAHQIKGSPLLKKNGDMFVHKILNPWVITTPPGYSCLFLPPMNNGNDIFEIIPAIVDTDKHKIPVNFPFIVKHNPKEPITTVIKRGTPYVQIIPFKKESWKMNIKYFEDKEMITRIEKFNLLGILHNYKNKLWNKVRWS